MTDPRKNKYPSPSEDANRQLANIHQAKPSDSHQVKAREIVREIFNEDYADGKTGMDLQDCIVKEIADALEAERKAGAKEALSKNWPEYEAADEWIKKADAEGYRRGLEEAAKIVESTTLGNRKDRETLAELIRQRSQR